MKSIALQTQPALWSAFPATLRSASSARAAAVAGLGEFADALWRTAFGRRVRQLAAQTGEAFPGIGEGPESTRSSGMSGLLEASRVRLSADSPRRVRQGARCWAERAGVRLPGATGRAKHSRVPSEVGRAAWWRGPTRPELAPPSSSAAPQFSGSRAVPVLLEEAFHLGGEVGGYAGVEVGLQGRGPTDRLETRQQAISLRADGPGRIPTARPCQTQRCAHWEGGPCGEAPGRRQQLRQFRFSGFTLEGGAPVRVRVVVPVPPNRFRMRYCVPGPRTTPPPPVVRRGALRSWRGDVPVCP